MTNGDQVSLGVKRNLKEKLVIGTWKIHLRIIIQSWIGKQS